MSKNSISGKIIKNYYWNRHGLQDLTADWRAQGMRPSTDQLQGWAVRLSQTQSTHRVEMTTFWRTFHHDGKISPAFWGRGEFTVTPTPFHYIYHHAQRCSVCSRWAQIHSPIFYSTSICNLWFNAALVHRRRLSWLSVAEHNLPVGAQPMFTIIVSSKMRQCSIVQCVTGIPLSILYSCLLWKDG